MGLHPIDIALQLLAVLAIVIVGMMVLGLISGRIF